MLWQYILYKSLEGLPLLLILGADTLIAGGLWIGYSTGVFWNIFMLSISYIINNIKMPAFLRIPGAHSPLR
jgi:hypothetical protein